MDSSIEVSASSMDALGEQYRAIAHNLANASTSGYKRRLSTFVQTLQQTLKAADSPVNASSQMTGLTLVDHTQGALTQTGRPLDLALEGKGFFVVETPGGRLYTRNGAFHLNPQRQIVDTSGRSVLGEAGPITLPSGAGPAGMNVSADGAVTAGGQQVGKLRIVEFADPALLAPAGLNCFRAPKDAETKASAATRVHQGYQEASNVNVVEELVSLITVSRLYEANVRSIRTQDDRMKNILEVAMA